MSANSSSNKKQVVSSDIGDMKVALYFKGSDEDRPIGGGSESFQLTKKSETGYVGLLNQGATCYLNSLIQSLFLTPRFRRAVLEWTYEPEKHGDKQYCIPYQMQLLFSRLLLSIRPAVGTQDLTHSFRWNSLEAFRQHDIQELMRVLFDALEKSLGGKENSKFLCDLYEGCMIDYIHCPECGEKREKRDKFLDIGLVVQKEIHLVDALKEFVTPEQLTADNMWMCSGCNKKVQATKGLRLSELPEIMTIQLKRFIYDPIRRGRVKVNVPVRFDQDLDMTDIVADGDCTNKQYKLYAVLMHNGSATGGHYFAYIKTRNRHTGVEEWLEFNDSVVSPLSGDMDEKKDSGSSITPSSSDAPDATGEAQAGGVPEPAPHDPLVKAYGRSDSGMSAYMLMYKRCSSSVTEEVQPVEQGPETCDAEMVQPQIREVVEKEDQEWKAELEEIERKRREMEVNVIYKNREYNFAYDLGTSLKDVTDDITRRLQLDQEFSPDQVRLRMFAAELGLAQTTFTDREHLSLQELGFLRTNLVLLETRSADESFPEYDPNETSLRVRPVTASNLVDIVEHCTFPHQNGIAEDTHTICIHREHTVKDLKRNIQDVTDIPMSQQRLIRLTETRATVFVEDSKHICDLGLSPGVYIYVERLTDEEVQRLGPDMGQMVESYDVTNKIVYDGVVESEPVSPGTIHRMHTAHTTTTTNNNNNSNNSNSNNMGVEKRESGCGPHVDLTAMTHIVLCGESTESDHKDEECDMESNTPIVRDLAMLDNGDTHQRDTHTPDLYEDFHNDNHNDNHNQKEKEKDIEERIKQHMKVSALVHEFERQKLQITIEFNNPNEAGSGGEGEGTGPETGEEATTVIPVYNHSVRTSKITTILQLKELISPIVDIPVSEFRLRASSAGKMFKNEELTLSECNLTEKSIVFVERGRTLKKDEYDFKFYLFQPHQSSAKMQYRFLFTLPFSRSILISSLKAELLDWLNQIHSDGKRGNVFGITDMRLREKIRNKNRVGKIYLDKTTLARNIKQLSDSTEIAIQKLDGPEHISNQDMCVWVQYFDLDTLSTGKSEELIIRSSAKVEEFKQKIAALSGIDSNHIGITKAHTHIVSMTSAQASKQVFDDVRINNPELLIKTMPLRVHDGDLVLFQDTSKASEEVQERMREKLERLRKKKEEKGKQGYGVSTKRRKKKKDAYGSSGVKYSTRPSEQGLRIGVVCGSNNNSNNNANNDTSSNQSDSNNNSSSSSSNSVSAEVLEKCTSIQAILPDAKQEEIIQCLNMCAGNVEMAISMLL